MKEKKMNITQKEIDDHIKDLNEILKDTIIPFELGNKMKTAHTSNSIFPSPKDDCINWQGAKSSLGYGKILYGGKTRTITRVLFEVIHGKIKKGMFVCHSCDNPSCINPSHLHLGTAQQNVDDMLRKGRVRSHSSNKTHCPQGHEYTASNTYNYKNMRHCKACVKERSKKYQTKKRAALAKAKGDAA